MEETKKKPIYKRWWFWVGIVIIVIIASNLGGNKQTTPSEAATASPAPAASAAAKATAAPAAKSEFAIGEAAKQGNIVLTVSDVKRTQGQGYDKPKAGNQYVIVTLTIENQGDTNQTYNSFYFKIANSQGNVTDPEYIATNEDNRLESGELAPKGKITASLAFQQPVGDPKLQLQYQSSVFSNKTLKINLQ